MMKKKAIIIILSVICIIIIAFHFFLIKIFYIPKSASAFGKYENLLQVIKRPEDKKEYGNYKDLGIVNRNFKLIKRLKNSYWVYVTPKWYIWETVNLEHNSEIVSIEYYTMQEFKDKLYPDIKRDIDSAAGFVVPVEVNWETLVVEGYAVFFLKHVQKYILTRL